MKKRGDIIGDGQHTSLLHGAKAICPRCNVVITGIKFVALEASKITGKLKHCLEYNVHLAQTTNFFSHKIIGVETLDFSSRSHNK